MVDNVALKSNAIRKHLNCDQSMNITILKETSSTNDDAKRIFMNRPEDSVLVATNRQTAGRGRRGKSFYSGLAHGLYFSLALTPNSLNKEDYPMYTLLTAAALVKTFKKYVPEPVGIKWVNDIFYRGRKVSGILSELGIQNQDDNAPYIVIGIGINFAGEFKEAEQEVQTVAGTLFGKILPHRFDQNHFLADFIQEFMKEHSTFEEKNFLSIYEKHLLGIGEEVSYKADGEKQTGVIKGINVQGNLLVTKSDQTVETLVGQTIEFGSSQFVKD